VLIVTAIALTLLAALTLILSGNLLFPPALFCCTWALTLLGLCLVGNTFYDVGEYACLIFLVGAVAFSSGGVLELLRRPCPEPMAGVRPRSDRMTRTALDFLLLGLVALFPYYLRVAYSITGGSEGGLALAAIRQTMVESEGANPFGSFAANLNLVAPLVAMALYYETDGTWAQRWRAAVAIAVALAYNALTGSKGGVLFLLTLFFVGQVKAGRIRMVAAASAAAAVVSTFAGGLLLVNFYGRSFADLSTAVQELGTAAASYWLGAPVALARSLKGPTPWRLPRTSVDSSWKRATVSDSMWTCRVFTTNTQPSVQAP
jgi:oligosaccharide repeat unit polymerase